LSTAFSQGTGAPQNFAAGVPAPFTGLAIGPTAFLAGQKVIAHFTATLLKDATPGTFSSQFFLDGAPTVTPVINAMPQAFDAAERQTVSMSAEFTPGAGAHTITVEGTSSAGVTTQSAAGDSMLTLEVVDTGAEDRTVEVARSCVGDRLRAFSHPWAGFADARNTSLRLAHEAGAEWALMLDSDEFTDHPVGFDLARELAAVPPPTDVLLLAARDGSHMRERVFRLPITGRFVGKTHEAFVGNAAPFVPLGQLVIGGDDKTPDELAHKWARDRVLLEEQIRAEPKDARWAFYLGETLYGLREWRAAADAYQSSMRLGGWEQQAAFAAFRASVCFEQLGLYEAGVSVALRGMQKHAGFAECPWQAALCFHRAGNQPQAARFARIAVALGRYAGHAEPSTCHRYLSALYEGPFNVLRHALAELGDREGASKAEEDYQAALAMREGG
jgi:hypothetical protein